LSLHPSAETRSRPVGILHPFFILHPSAPDLSGTCREPVGILYPCSSVSLCGDPFFACGRRPRSSSATCPDLSGSFRLYPFSSSFILFFSLRLCAFASLRSLLPAPRRPKHPSNARRICAERSEVPTCREAQRSSRFLGVPIYRGPDSSGREIILARLCSRPRPAPCMATFSALRLARPV
jgi:hypothetical protein